MITDLTISDEAARPFGLARAQLKGLGKVVLLAGPNGSGKTRYLQLVENLAQEARSARVQHAALVEQRIDAQRKLDNASEQLALAHALGKSRDNAIERVQALAVHRNEIDSEIARHERALDAVVHGAPLGAIARLADGMSSQQVIQDASALAPAQLHSMASGVRNIGLSPVLQGMHVYLTQIAQTLFDGKHPELEDNPQVREDLAQAAALNEIVRRLLGGEVGYAYLNSRVVPTVLGRVFFAADLSPGQKVLLGWAIVIHMQRATLEGGVFFLDEPENHLLPSACVDAVRRLAAAIGERGQLWIATHSLALVAERGLGDLYLVKDGAITFARDKMTDILSSLLGGPEGRLNMLTMLGDAELVAGAKFLAECFEAPRVVDTSGPDRQKTLLQDALGRVAAAERPLKILDYGAGKGRLATAIATSAPQAKLQYFALNAGPCSTEDADACRRHISNLEQGVGEFYWDDVTKLLATERGAFDVVVLSNVLHEIHPDHWKEVFQELHDLLGPEGLVLIMEDLLPPIGELAHRHGFLMLDQYGLRVLFGDNTIAPVRPVEDGRLTVVAVARASLKQLTQATKRAAIEHVRDHARKKVEILRSASERTVKSAREHAHYLVQYASASLALRGLE